MREPDRPNSASPSGWLRICRIKDVSSIGMAVIKTVMIKGMTNASLANPDKFESGIGQGIVSG
jgi:hypothetical protein